MAMNLEEYAKTGLETLNSGVPGISINGLNKEDTKYLVDFYKSEGFDVSQGKEITKENVGTIYPITVFHKTPVGVNQNA